MTSSIMSQDNKEIRNSSQIESLRRRFNELRVEMKEKKMLSDESKKLLLAQQTKFIGSEKLDSNLQVMLHMEVTNIRS
jgi:hypothetical protein